MNREISPIKKGSKDYSPADHDNTVEISEDMIPGGNITDDCSDNSAPVSDYRSKFTLFIHLVS